MVTETPAHVAGNDDSARGATRTPSVERTNSAACKEQDLLVNHQLPTTATVPSTPTGQCDEFTGNAAWIAEFHRNELLKVDDNKSRALTDQRHLTLDKAHADYWGTGHGRSHAEEYANQVMSTAIFYLGAAVKASTDPAQALNALHVALGMTTEEG